MRRGLNSLEDLAAALPTETSVETDLLSATPFPSSQETKLKERSSVVRLWRRAREVLEKPTANVAGIQILFVLISLGSRMNSKKGASIFPKHPLGDQH